MSDELKFTCEVCGKEFDADPDTMVEVGLSAHRLAEGEAPPEDGEFLSRADVEEMDAEELAELGLTPDQRDALLRGEDVTTGGMCICTRCQDEALEAEGGA